MPNTIIVTRHEAAVEWLRKSYPEGAAGEVTRIGHMDWRVIERLRPGDKVIGVLPIHLVAELTRRGVTYFGISIPNLPKGMRGTELSADEMEQFGAHLTEYAALGGRGSLDRLIAAGIVTPSPHDEEIEP